MRPAWAWLVAVCAGVALWVPAAHADTQVDKLQHQAKEAHAKGAFDEEADDLCQAAVLDPKYGKKCARARAEVDRQLKAFQGFLGTGQFELQQKDYPGAIRDLSRITFGPLRDQAQALIAQAKADLEQPAVEAASNAALHLAVAAYQKGDFATAAAQASQVHAADLQPQAEEIVTNIRVYQETMNEADALMQKSDYQNAEQKYAFALKIKDNGPGNPAEKLQQVQAILQKQATEPTAATAQSPKPPPAKIDYAARVKYDLDDAKKHEAAGELKAALQAYGQALALDSRQADALAGKKRVTGELRDEQEKLSDSLTQGIRSYYASDFAQASSALNLYLSGSDLRSEGAAHFYLAATLLSQALLAGPQDEGQTRDLRQGAEQQFELAKQAHYKPADGVVSPKILEEWAKAGSLQ
jgi:tetratricopeptide (TPR) repeat protein